MKEKTVATFALLLGVAALLAPSSVLADSTYSVTVDTSSLSGTSADLAFDLVDGGSASNTLTISGFATDGTLESVTPTGEVTGALPGTVTVEDSPSSFFNEYLTGIALGSSFSFNFDVTENGPGSSGTPDVFSLFLLDPTTGLPLFTTSDPTGSDSLFTINLDGSALSVYSSSVTANSGSVPAPEPNALLLMVGGVGGILLLLRRRKSALAEM